METKGYALLLMIICTLFTSAAQVFYKFGAARLPLIFTNYQLIIGLALYALAAIIFVVALKFGEVTMLYPIIATSYVWVAFLSWWIFGDVINVYKSLGIVAIVAGIIIISVGGNKR